MVYIKHPKHVAFEYSKITKYIYLGTNQCCTTHFKKKLLAKNIRADISLEKERLDSPFGVDYFLWLPVKDKMSPTQKQLLVGARMIKDLVDNKIKVYVHCKRGHSRSPSLVAAYFILEGEGAEKALGRIRAKRGIHLTKDQLDGLRKFKKSLSRDNFK